MSESLKLDILTDIENDVKKFSNIISKNLANRFAEELVNEYQYIVRNFYAEYTPKYYIRHIHRGYQIDGLLLTYKKYYKNPHNKIYYGGIEITSEKMYEDYSDSNVDVLNSFLNGFHGRPSLHINSKINVWKHMTQYRDLLMSNYGSYVEDAVQIAKNEQYSALKFI